ncbi:CerR family C-terminal domain-containing protein [Agrobacterium sp. a22-2]|uniref:TetR/AcrR family transcriptional regulator n=1 Tax=Agrobacterium sp. a22-2 TaxID=2283840 RepID=UPI0014488D08|nr:CerR family C-terminal domain-containing protein [Agrobacterium sp. a22-2]NKN38977.1 CerR family C-terminal domain-containing protein [Agrobacterium sp. a22-2]
MKSMRRHKTESAYPRGEETRARIIRTAIALFGEKGFAGVSTREIAAAADVPAPSLQYYFENKEGLYKACLEDIQAAATEAAGPALAHAEALIAAQSKDVTSLIEAYCDILDRLADFMFDAPDSASRALFVAQQHAPTSSASRPVADKPLGRRIRQCCTGLIAAISRGDPSAEDLQVRAATINGQLLVVHLTRHMMSELIGWDEMTSARLAVVKSTIRTQTTVVLKSYR